MKAFAQYDGDGVIRSLIALDAPAGIKVGLESGPRVSTTEIDAKGLQRLFAAADVDALNKFADSHQVAAPRVSRSTLRKKKARKK